MSSVPPPDDRLREIATWLRQSGLTAAADAVASGRWRLAPLVGEPVCTGATAFWCPLHGDCSCPRDHEGECAFDDPSCPLHSENSEHGGEDHEPSAARAEWAVVVHAELAERTGSCTLCRRSTPLGELSVCDECDAELCPDHTHTTDTGVRCLECFTRGTLVIDRPAT